MTRSAMTALLSVLAVAGFQNRDKIAEMLKGLSQNLHRSPDPSRTSASDPATQISPAALAPGRVASVGGP